MKKVFLSIIMMVFILTSCNENKGLAITGNVSDAKNMKIHLYKLNLGEKPSVLMSKSIDGDGNFEFKFPEGLDMGTYNLKVGNRGVALSLDGSEKNIIIDGSMSTFNTGEFEIKGSNNTKTVYDMLSKLKKKELTKDEFVAEFKTQDPAIQYTLSGMMYGNNPAEHKQHQIVLDNIINKYGESDLTKGYASFIEKLQLVYAKQMAKEKIKIGNIAPEIALPNPEGKIIKLSDYKGKLVLLDFWAAWCGPCRMNNPRLVALYEKYHDKGFDIYSVSLDGDRKGGTPQQMEMLKARHKEKWVTAIKKDKLTWDGHVSDLKAWKSEAAATYGVSAIPKTYLIDKEGKIIAINPHSNLEELIKENL